MTESCLEPFMAFASLLGSDSLSDPTLLAIENSSTAGTDRDGPVVLVVDDEKLIVDTMIEILEGAGFEAIGAYGGWDALEKIARRQPDYVLSDVLMPQMNGVELAIAIRKMHPTARIVLFSGQAGISEILLDGHKQGFEFELLAKPIHPLKLIEYLKE
jgi:CheY-like chemotaxis protein